MLRLPALTETPAGRLELDEVFAMLIDTAAATLIAPLDEFAGGVAGAESPLPPFAVRTPLPGEARVVVVVKGPAFESPSKLRELAPPDVQVVQSSRAWEDFGIEMSPYFCFVDGTTGKVRSEGAAMTWEQVASLLRDVLLDEELAART